MKNLYTLMGRTTHETNETGRSFGSNFGKVAILSSILTLFLVFFNSNANAQCNQTLYLYDSYGDGWNGGSINVYVGGAYVGNYTIGSGSSATYTFSANAGQAISISYSAGGWAYENYYTVVAGNGSTLVSNWYPSSSGTWNGTAACSAPSYCTPYTNYPYYMGISQVVFNTINNYSGTTNYTFQNFTNLSTNVEAGSTTNLFIAGWSYEQYATVWVDLNDNLVFEASERLATGVYMGYNCNIGITIPNGTSVGNHRMRIRTQYYYDGIQYDPCATTNYGETEDYTINITAPCAPPATVGFGTNTWNVLGYEHGGYNYGNIGSLAGNTFKGYYTDATVDINSQARWISDGTPSSASGWTGCPVSIDNHTVVYKRQGFPTAFYQIDLNTHDDGVQCYVNGTLVYEIDGCCTDRGVIWSGVLCSTSTVEFRVMEGGGGSNLAVDFIESALTAGTISGTQTICPGSTTNLTTTGNAGGTWTTSNAAVAAVNSSTGLVTAIGSGSATITYTVNGGTCGNVTATYAVTVVAGASAGLLTGTQTACVGATTTFTSNGTAGGTWSSDNSGIASVNASTGVISGVSAGTATITYTVLGSGGCPNATATRTVTISASPTVNAGNDVAICAGQTVNIGGSGATGTLPNGYCGANATNQDETINNVSMNGGSQSSGWNGYADYSGSTFTTLTPGNTYNLSVSWNVGGTYNEYVRAFFDWDRNGSFESSYLVGSGSSASTTWITSIPVPSNAASGISKMRIILKYASDAGSCDANFAYGEVEDYTINIPSSITYNWSPSTGLSSINVANPSATPSATTTYTLTGTLNGCSASDAVLVTVAAPTMATLPTTGDMIWKGETNTDWTILNNWWEYNGSTYVSATAAPGTAQNVIIPASQTCVLNQPNTFANSGNAKNLTIETGATLTMGTGTLVVNGNWINNNVFVAGTGTVQFGGGINTTIGGSAASNDFYNVTMNKTGEALLVSPATISNSLTLTNGNLNIAGFTIDMASNAINGGSAGSYVKTSGSGVLKRDVSSSLKTFPVGNSAYNPAGLTNIGTADNYGVRVIDNVTNDGTGVGTTTTDPVVKRTWMISETSLGGSDVSLQLYWNGVGEEINSFNLANSPYMAHYSAAWDNIGGTVTANVADKSGITTFSPFTIKSTFSALPIELISFQANCIGNNKVDVTWATASEHNTSHFVVEKSRDGLNWTILNTLGAAGNSTTVIEYALTDNDVASGTTYYRLTQFDNDGVSETFNVASVNCGVQQAITSNLVTYPNPSNGSFYVDFYTQDITGPSMISVFDSRGMVIYRQEVLVEKGSNVFHIEDLDAAPGMYYIKVSNGTTTSYIVKHSLR